MLEFCCTIVSEHYANEYLFPNPHREDNFKFINFNSEEKELAS